MAYGQGGAAEAHEFQQQFGFEDFEKMVEEIPGTGKLAGVDGALNYLKFNIEAVTSEDAPKVKAKILEWTKGNPHPDAPALLAKLEDNIQTREVVPITPEPTVELRAVPEQPEDIPGVNPNAERHIDEAATARTIDKVGQDLDFWVQQVEDTMRQDKDVAQVMAREVVNNKIGEWKKELGGVDSQKADTLRDKIDGLKNRFEYQFGNIFDN